MYLRSLVILSMVLLAVAFGSLTWFLLVPAEPRPVPVASTAEVPALAPRARVLVAARALAAGSLLRDEDFVARELPPEAASLAPVPATAESRNDVRGALLRRYLDSGAVLERDDVLRARDRGFLASVLRPGMRAISVGVDLVTGTAGLIWPGDHVDLILTQELQPGDAPLGRRVIGETVLADARVVAVDQQLTQGAGAEGAPSRVARTITLEVRAEQAERVAVASRLGRIALTVRSSETPEAEAASPARSIFGADVSQALSASSHTQGARMQVIQGDERVEVTFR
ncbi:Flp pilus assembly protein CpaB [Sediminicoccus rosea]|jgi:pilus assembly protein CpaB|uniref:Flp pilus assembly protein CpaB n=1 Tax=Sediminicoccus rosea TaxID=1225128 RepID=A0ABZ0PEL1_9PROT|nr:Flp pilus assembly protein CpaB [Sediminicoccus rosea]WPB83917.1 Flp pilus assembly protein CpaB [Sediminicoccus rosea]